MHYYITTKDDTMKTICNISGLELTISYFPDTIYHPSIVHPVFLIPQKKLLAKGTAYFTNPSQYNSTDAYLLFLALLNSTELIEWKTPALRTVETDHTIANNMEALIRVIGKISLISHPSFVLAKVAINKDTRDLSNVKYWIDSWEESIQEFKDGYRSYSDTRALLNRELALERLIKNPMKSVDNYARSLSEWAAMAGSFPKSILDFGSYKIHCDDYWKGIISKCVREESIFSIPANDLQELIDWCEEYISHGSIYSHALMTLLRIGRKKQSDYLNLGDFSITILDADASVEQANKLAMIAAAPDTEPTPNQYPNKLAYIKAKARWELAQTYTPSQSTMEESE